MKDRKMAVKSENEIVSELYTNLQKTTSEVDQVTILTDLEYYLHQVSLIFSLYFHIFNYFSFSPALLLLLLFQFAPSLPPRPPSPLFLIRLFLLHLHSLSSPASSTSPHVLLLFLLLMPLLFSSTPIR